MGYAEIKVMGGPFEAGGAVAVPVDPEGVVGGA